MKGSIRLFKVFDISINIHITFILLLLLFLSSGPKWLFLIVAVFCFVTIHELCHSLVAKHYGINVREITLLPIGGVASMTKIPDKPSQEFFIAIAGPLFNLLIIVILFYPLKYLLGPEVLFHHLSTKSWPLTIAHVYWINLILAAFNLIPAFPMDGGRVLRALLAVRIGYQKATKIAVNFGHIFALLFAYLGITRFNLVLIAIAIFIYMAASSEELQVDIKETLKKFRVRDILSHDFYTLRSDATLAKVLEAIFHSHQEDFPIVDDGRLVGFITRQEIITNLHQFGMDKLVRDVMRTDFPKAKDTDSLIHLQNIMQDGEIRAVPVVRGDEVLGVITIEDIGRIYAMISQRT